MPPTPSAKSRKVLTYASTLAVMVGSAAITNCSGDPSQPSSSSSSSSNPTTTGGSQGTGGGGGGDGVPFQADPPEVYVAKVKNILVGLAPTDDEVKQVKADPEALKTLIDGWMALPEYQAKMQVFFELAFQQTQITSADFIDMVGKAGLGRGGAVPNLVLNIRESFARTVLALIDEGKPLNAAMTTKRLMMTPALMELYAFLDSWQVADDSSYSDRFGDAHPKLNMVIEAKDGPIPIEKTLDPTDAQHYMHWYDPDILGFTFQGVTEASCAGLDPIMVPATSYNIHDLLYGGVEGHKGKTLACAPRGGSTTQFTDDDFNTWKMVTIRPPTGGEAPTLFFDIPKLRSSNELVINTPRPGFFSTPAFFANWSTNTSNQMRVTLNQALIVATGMAVDGTDLTTPMSTPGLDAKHAAPGTACFACHQTLDPTRAILSSTWTYAYGTQDVKSQINQKGLFAFQGVEKPVSSIDDFAAILATHPAFPTAWAQKLCYYTNSKPCLPDDPEFLRIVKVFQDSKLSWNALVRELLSSPLTTNATATKTTASSETVAVARRDHLCAALNFRLGLVDVCGLSVVSKLKGKSALIPQIVAGLPSDGYGRGATEPILPNDPTLFYRAGLENVCEAVAARVIDAPADPMAPDAKHWVSTGAPDAAIAEFVGTIMALTPSDARAKPAAAILKDHFIAAVQSGETPSSALKSTFVAACLSPSAIGIGM